MATGAASHRGPFFFRLAVRVPTCRRRLRFSLGNFQLTLPAKSTLPFSSSSTVVRRRQLACPAGREGLEKSLQVERSRSAIRFISARVASTFRRLITDQRSICLSSSVFCRSRGDAIIQRAAKRATRKLVHRGDRCGFVTFPHRDQIP